MAWISYITPKMLQIVVNVYVFMLTDVGIKQAACPGMPYMVYYMVRFNVKSRPPTFTPISKRPTLPADNVRCLEFLCNCDEDGLKN